jgi:hypothetical protein
VTVLSDLATRADAELAKRGAGWIDDLLVAARTVLPPGASRAREEGEAALAKIDGHRADLIHLGRYGLAATLGALARGDELAARIEYLRDRAGAQELLVASLQGTRAGIVAADARREAASRALGVLRAIGVEAARAALPLLLAVI